MLAEKSRVLQTDGTSVLEFISFDVGTYLQIISVKISCQFVQKCVSYCARDTVDADMLMDVQMWQ